MRAFKMRSMTDANFGADLARLVSTRARRPGPPCGTQRALEDLIAKHPENAEGLRDALDASSRIAASDVADFFTKYGHPLASQSVQRHRRRGTSTGCQCPQ